MAEVHFDRFEREAERLLATYSPTATSRSLDPRKAFLN
jgi:hypothetical protein